LFEGADVRELWDFDLPQAEVFREGEGGQRDRFPAADAGLRRGVAERAGGAGGGDAATALEVGLVFQPSLPVGHELDFIEEQDARVAFDGGEEFVPCL